jgi:superfamily I DNA/RNA helicase
MFNQYADLILLIATTVEALTILVVILLLIKVDNLEKINKRIIKRNITLRDENIGWRSTIPRTIRVGEANAKDIKTLSEQQQHLNKFMGQVLNISNLIPNEELGIEASDIIEELRERVKWAEELEKYKETDEENFYKGD